MSEEPQATASLLPMGSAAASSAEFTLADGQSATLYPMCSFGNHSGYGVWLERKTSGGTWQRMDQLTSKNGYIVRGAGTWRVTRDTLPASVQVGVDRG